MGSTLTPVKPPKTTQHATMPAKRVNFVLSARAYSDLQALSTAMSRSMTELVRLGIGLLKVVLEADQKGQKLAVINGDGEVVKEIVLP
jgi:hypothetical protein